LFSERLQGARNCVLQKKRICSARSASVSPGLQVHSTCNMGVLNSYKKVQSSISLQVGFKEPFKSLSKAL